MNKNHLIFNSSILLIAFFAMINFTACNKNKEPENPMIRDHMLMDRLDQAEKYFDMHPDFKKAFEFLRQPSLADLPLERHEIDGDRMFCTISKKQGRKKVDVKLEAHRKYIDIQYVIAGTDEMGWRPTSTCTIQDVSYDPEKDYELFKDEPKTWTKVPAGSFAIFFPQDAHAPMYGDEIIHKAVLKVAVK